MVITFERMILAASQRMHRPAMLGLQIYIEAGRGGHCRQPLVSPSIKAGSQQGKSTSGRLSRGPTLFKAHNCALLSLPAAFCSPLRLRGRDSASIQMLGGFSVLRSRAVLPLSLATPTRFLRRLPHPSAVSSSSSPPLQPPPGMEASYKFGPYKIDAREVFHATPLSYAMVNLRPLLPGIIPFPLFTSPLPMLCLPAVPAATPPYQSFLVCGCYNISHRERKGEKIPAFLRKCG